MSTEIQRFQRTKRNRLIIGAGLLTLAGIAGFCFEHFGRSPQGHSEVSSQSRKGLQRYTPTPSEWASLTIERVGESAFRAEHVTEGKIAVDEDRSTPVFSPYAGRVTKLLARPGGRVVVGEDACVVAAA